MQESEYSTETQLNFNKKYSLVSNKPYYYLLKERTTSVFNYRLPKLPLALRNIHFTTNQKLLTISAIAAYVIQDALGIYCDQPNIRGFKLIEMNNIYKYKFKQMNATRYVFKRVKERSIMEAMQSVDEWRRLFKNGEIDDNGNKIKYSLKQAAEKVGVPKKTLEDYHQLLKKAKHLLDLNEVGDKKMGYLRNFLKQQQQQIQQQRSVFSDEEQYQLKEEEMDEEPEYEDMIVEGPIQVNDEEFDFCPIQYVSLVLIPQLQPLSHKKFEIPVSDYEDCETDDEFDYE